MKRTASRLLPLLAWSLALPALAQTAEEESVARRPRPDFEASGIAWPDLADGLDRLFSSEARRQPRDDASSDLLLFPSAQSTLIADSNALRRQSGGQGDFAEQIGAGLVASETDELGGWSLGASGHGLRYLRFSSQNGDEGKLHQSGYVAPTDELRAELSLDEQWLVEPIEDSGTGYRQQRPNRYALYKAMLTADYTTEDWRIAATQQALAYRYDQNPPVILGDEIDHEELSSVLRVTRSLFEGSALFVEPSVNLRIYVREIGVDGLRHNSSGGQVLAGLRYDLSSVTFVEAGAGWLRQDYADHAFATVSGPALNARAAWNPFDQVSLTLGATRQIAETNLPGTAGAEITAETLAADYEITDNLLAGCSFSYTDMGYKSALGQSSRTDDIMQAGVELRYLIDRNFSLAASWTDYQRSSTVLGAALVFQRFSLSGQVQW